jgi:hypothetical protein
VEDSRARDFQIVVGHMNIQIFASRPGDYLEKKIFNGRIKPTMARWIMNKY